MIKAILFDLDNTLYDSRKMAETARKEAVEAMLNAGLNGPSKKETYEKLLEIIKQEGSNHSKHFDLLCEHYQGKAEPRIVSAGIVAYHKTKSALLHLYPGVDKLLVKLLKKGYSLGIVTNGIAVKQWDKIHRLGILEFFDSFVISDMEHTTSSKVGLLNQALKDLNVTKEETLFIGDSLEADVKSAQELGMNSVLVGTHTSDTTIKPTHHIEHTKDLLTLLKQIDT